MRRLLAPALATAATAGLLALAPAAPAAAAAAAPGAGIAVVGSKTTITAARRGARVTVAGAVTRYSPTAGRHVAWAGARVTILTRTRNTAPWQARTVIRSGSDGRVPARSWSAGRPTYVRLEVGPGTAWGSAAARKV